MWKSVKKPVFTSEESCSRAFSSAYSGTGVAIVVAVIGVTPLATSVDNGSGKACPPVVFDSLSISDIALFSMIL